MRRGSVWLRPILGVLMGGALLGCGASSLPGSPHSTSEARSGAKAAVQRYLDALGRGDAESACRALSQTGLESAGASSLTGCVSDYRDTPRALGRVPIVAVRLHGLYDADVELGDAAMSDSGNDTVTVHYYRSRGWLLDAG